jgi:hypothetical protein
MDTLRGYSDDHENNQRIVFAALSVRMGMGWWLFSLSY